MKKFSILFFLLNSLAFAGDINDSFEQVMGQYGPTRKFTPPVKAIEEPNESQPSKYHFLNYLTVDYLYWGAKKTGILFYETVFPHDKFVSKVQEKAQWASGVRADIGFPNIYDWMINGCFTHYKNSFNRNYDLGGEILNNNIPLPYPPFIAKILLPFTDSNTKFRLKYWTCDLDISTTLNLASSVTIKPVISARGAQFKYYLQFSAHSYDLYGEPINVIIKQPLCFLGFGPKFGVNAFFKFNNTGLSSFGALNASLLYGKVKYVDSLNTGSSYYIDNYSKGKYHDLKASLGLVLGLEYKLHFGEYTKAFMLRAVWEANYWWDLIDHIVQAEILGRKSLILYGLSIGLGYEF